MNIAVDMLHIGVYVHLHHHIVFTIIIYVRTAKVFKNKIASHLVPFSLEFEIKSK